MDCLVTARDLVYVLQLESIAFTKTLYGRTRELFLVSGHSARLKASAKGTEFVEFKTEREREKT
jgi:branched-subunit amino acid aminotransferase/4-amino-4-deoxychorismate lyase